MNMVPPAESSPPVMNYYSVIALLLGLTVILVTFSSLLLRGTTQPDSGPNVLGRVFLVLLRLAIGWHCFVEGMDKLQNPAWSGETYLRESVGPLAGPFRWLAGDRVLDRLTVADTEHPPSALAADFDRYTDAFIAHYELDAEQADRARESARQGKNKAHTWLTSDKEKEEVQKIAPYPPTLKLQWPMEERLAEYERLRIKVAEVEQLLPTNDKAVHKRYADARADLNKWRGDLKRSYDAHFATFKKSLLDVLTDSQKKETAPLADPLRVPVTSWGLLEWSDLAVEWSLVLIGVALMLGLLSRLASAAGAMLILSFFLAMPPLPGFPESPRLEGHYLFINKTLIEVLALASLACLPTGRWAGVDALIHPILPWNWPRRQPVAPPALAPPTAAVRSSAAERKPVKSGAS